MKLVCKALIVMCLMIETLSASIYLPEKYLVTYGNPNAAIKITEYYSFFCPHCVALFRRDFPSIRDKYLNTGEIYLVFHPVPMDLLTVQAMDCLEKLSPHEKRLFLQAVLEEIDITEVDLCTKMLEKAMRVMNLPSANLSDKAYLENTNAFKDAFEFIKRDSKPEAIPSVAINGCFLPGEIPSEELIQRCLKKRGAVCTND